MFNTCIKQRKHALITNQSVTVDTSFCIKYIKYCDVTIFDCFHIVVKTLIPPLVTRLSYKMYAIVPYRLAAGRNNSEEESIATFLHDGFLEINSTAVDTLAHHT